ncbi:MAG TPA: amino acid permease, partial [Nitrospiraceae bacterium]|nr:amino acid permease [Nitrospiraceae bacterium]
MSEPSVIERGAVARPRIGWFTASCVLVSNMIGGGIFTTTGFMARDLGDPYLILSLWLVGGLLAMAAAMSYSELPAALPDAGGDYVYLRHAYGSFTGFLSGWTSFTVGFGAGIAAASVSFASYVLRAVPLAEDNSITSKTIALALVWVLTAVHAAGTGAGGRLQRVLTTTKVLAIVLLIFGGLLLGHGSWQHVEQSPPNNPGIGPLIVALIFVIYTYLGWNVVGYIAGEIADPQRMIPKIVIGGTAFVAVLYLLLNLVYLYALPVMILAQAPVLPVAEKAAAALWGPSSAELVAALLCVSIAGGVSAMVWAGPRVYWAMAINGVFPPFFKALAPSSGVPARAMYAQSGWVSLLILTGTFEQLIIFSGFVLSAFTALAIGAVIVLRQRRPDLVRPYRVPF